MRGTSEMRQKIRQVDMTSEVRTDFSPHIAGSTQNCSPLRGFSYVTSSFHLENEEGKLLVARVVFY
jgi:hypothetical protein